ncbi:hypothetical protein VNO77_40462 [Canavalia gladiata]|uniref:AT-hook motif nuclear-localized protein n=1 Tax=Canavalia gladiata TaxID=3824 RepID=A0AAN9PR50_CANGL
MNTIKVSESNNIQMNSVAVTEMGQPSEVPPPFTFTAGGSNAAAPATMRRNDMLAMSLRQGSNRNSVRITVVVVNSCEGNFEISSLEGNIVLPKKHNKKNKNSQVTVLVAGNDSRIRGGPVRSLIAKSPVQVIISTMSKYGMQHKVCKEYSTANELSPLVDQAKHMTEVVDRIYKATLKELNETNTHA